MHLVVAERGSKAPGSKYLPRSRPSGENTSEEGSGGTSDERGGGEDPPLQSGQSLETRNKTAPAGDQLLQAKLMAATTRRQQTQHSSDSTDVRLNSFLAAPEWCAPSKWIERTPILLANALNLWSDPDLAGLPFDRVDLVITHGGPALIRRLEDGDQVPCVGEIGLFPWLEYVERTLLAGAGNKSGPAGGVQGRVVGTTFIQRLEHYLAGVVDAEGHDAGEDDVDHAEEHDDEEQDVNDEEHDVDVEKGVLDAGRNGGDEMRLNIIGIGSWLVGKRVGVLSHGSCDSYLVEAVVRQSPREEGNPEIVPLNEFYGQAEVLLPLDGGNARAPPGSRSRPHVDACCLVEPELSRALSADFTRLLRRPSPAEDTRRVEILQRFGDLPAARSHGFQWGGLVASNAFLDSDRGRDILRRMLRVYRASVELMHRVVVGSPVDVVGESVRTALLHTVRAEFGVAEEVWVRALRRTSGYFPPGERRAEPAGSNVAAKVGGDRWQQKWWAFEETGMLRCRDMMGGDPLQSASQEDLARTAYAREFGESFGEADEAVVEKWCRGLGAKTTL